MAELAVGAVTSLLGLLRNEALLLSGVGHDVQFIKEEMESMNSFLKHLGRTAPPGGEHDEQVMTWMKQVRELANDCSNFFDGYLQRRDQQIHRAKGNIRYYIYARWSWLVRRVVAKHKAAFQLRELKDRARDVGERRVRYGVEVPAKSAARLSPPSFPGTADAGAPSMPSSSSSRPSVSKHEVADEDYEEEDDDDGLQYQAVANSSSLRRRALEPRRLEDYYAKKLEEWFEQLGKTETEGSIPCITIVAPATENAGTIAREAWRLVTKKKERWRWINLQVVQRPGDLPLLAKEILCHILYALKQPALEQQGKVDEKKIREEGYSLRSSVYSEINDNIGKIDIDKRITEVKNKLEEFGKIGHVESNSSKPLDEPLGVLYEALLLLLKDNEKPPSEKDIRKGTAHMLQCYMERGDQKPAICLDINRYQDILQNVFPDRKPQQAQDEEATTTSSSAMALGEEQIKQIILKVTPDIIVDMLPEAESQLQPQANSVIQQTTGSTLAPGSADQIAKKNVVAAASTAENKEPEENVVTATAPEIKEPKKNAAAAEIEETNQNDVADMIKEIKETVAAVIKEIKENAAAAIKETKENATAAVIKEIKKNAASVAAARMKETKQNDAALAAMIKETREKMWRLKWVIREQLFIQGIVDKINKGYLEKTKTLIILQDDRNYLSCQSEEIKNALSFLDARSEMIVTTMDSKMAKKFCNPAKQEPINYSHVGLYHDSVLQLTSQQAKQGVYSSQILRDILDECGTDEFCMKIFLHALYANPNRSSKELDRLHETLRVSEKSVATNYRAKRMFKFSYNNLPREYKTCLLYLAIFPPGHNIRRSTIIGRWVAEGLITKEDWPTEVRHANRCFDALIDRWHVLPREIGASGRVKSCMVSDQVHAIITKIAKKQHIVETRLSLKLARHFNIFSDLRLRSSDKISKFVQNIYKFSQYLPLIKVLDVEGCNCFGKNNKYLKDICNKMLLLKYLSLRRTDVAHLPSEINNLHELEVLDIRQTCVDESDTKHVLLLKLKRLLAGCVDSSPSGTDDKRKPTISVRVPKKIGEMEQMEVLSNVHASKSGYELKNIGKLWQLRKLGVVLDDGNEDQLSYLLRAIRDRIDCLRSVSITISRNKSETTSSKKSVSQFTPNEGSKKRLEHLSNLLENLSIKGTTEKYPPLPLFAEESKHPLLALFVKESKQLTKVTLSSTLLDNLEDLAELPKLRCLKLRCKAYNEGGILTFKEDKFPALKYFIVEGQNMTKIIFNDKAIPELEKIVLSSTNINSISGVDKLPNLKEIELKGKNWRSQKDVGALESKAHDGDVSSPQPDPQPHQEAHTSHHHPPPASPSNQPESSNGGSGGPARNVSGGSGAPATDGSGGSGTSTSAPDGSDGSSAPAPEVIDKFINSLFGGANKISTVTLHMTSLTKGELHVLAKKPRMRCLVLLEDSYKESQLTFDEQDFTNLGLLTVDSPNITSISFNGGAPKLEKIAWSFTKMESLIGIKNLPRLNEVEFNSDDIPNHVKEDIKAHKNHIVPKYKKDQNHDPEDQSAKEDDEDSWFPTCSWLSKSKNCIGIAN